MNEQNLTDAFSGFSSLMLIKGLTLLSLFVYICFAFIVLKQVISMIKILVDPFNFLVKFVGLVLLGVSITVFIYILFFS